MPLRQEKLGYMCLLPPETTGLVSRLEFMPAGILEGFVAGRHRSPHKGASVEFAEHRQYTRGDDLRRLDWRVYGKKNRYYIRQYIEETSLRATLIVDASGSMNYRGTHAAKINGELPSKYEYARYVAAALTYLLIHQQDAAGLVLHDSDIRSYIPASSSPTQVRRVLEELHAATPGGDTALAPVLHNIAERIHRRGIVFILSDLFDDPQAILEALHHFAFRRHRVIVFHIMADEELTFPFDRFALFRDLEGAGQTVEADPETIRAEYLDRIREFTTTLRTGCSRMNALYCPMNTRERFDTILANLLARTGAGSKQGKRHFAGR